MKKDKGLICNTLPYRVDLQIINTLKNLLMQYFTAKARKEFWLAFIEFRRQWRGKYSMNDLARELGFSSGYVSEVINNKQRGEISCRFLCSSLELMKCTMREAYEIIPVSTDRFYTPSRVREQSEHSNPNLKQRYEERISALCYPADVERRKNHNYFKTKIDKRNDR